MKKSTKRIVLVMLFLLAGIFPNKTSACIGKIIVIGTSDIPTNRLAAEIIMQLITERTGTTTKIIYYDEDSQVKDGLVDEDENRQIDILLSNSLTGQWGISFIRTEKNIQQATTFILKSDNKNYDLWLLPDSTWISKNFDYYPLLRKNILTDFPMLPRLLSKITSRLTNKEFSILVEEVEEGKKAKNVAKRVLDQKGLI